jgi:integrase
LSASVGKKQTLHDLRLALKNGKLIPMLSHHLQTVAKKEPQTGRIENPRSFNRTRSVLSSFFQFLQDRYEFAQNPMHHFPALKINRKSTTPSMSEDELSVLLSTLFKKREESFHDFRNFLLVYLLSTLALRRQEVCLLRWDKLNMHEGWIDVIQKGNTTKRLPLRPFTLELLKNFRSAYAVSEDYIFFAKCNHLNGLSFVKKNEKSHSEAKKQDQSNTKEIPSVEAPSLWTSEKTIQSKSSQPRSPQAKLPEPKLSQPTTLQPKQPLSSSRVYQIVKGTLEDFFPGRGFSVHSFRKTFIEIANKQGINPVETMNATGHASVEMIAYYDTRNALANNAIHPISRGLEDSLLNDLNEGRKKG